MMQLITKKLLLNSLLLTVVLGSTNALAATKIIKWVDAQGLTHYGDRLPMPENVRQIKNDNMDSLSDTQTPENAAASKSQERYDFALINSYSSTNEIELARVRNIKRGQ